MGFDIDIYQIQLGKDSFGNPKAKIISSVLKELYLSYNWSNLSNYCPIHCISTNSNVQTLNTNDFNKICECKVEHLWYLRDDLHRRLGSDIAEKAKNVIKILEKAGFKIGEPDITNPDWGYGSKRINGEYLPMSHAERISVFMFHLNCFKEAGLQYKNSIFIADADDEDSNFLVTESNQRIPIIKSDDRDFISNTENSKDIHIEEDSTKQSYLVTYFMHPAKGLFRVDSFDTAMEVFSICRAQGDPYADRWKNLALQMPDAPIKTN
jgi:hypothetical protein